jgi:AcrR family transcriptional regulator
MVVCEGAAMPRPLGRRNPDYEDKRERLAQELTDFVLRSDLTRASFRQLAQAGGVAEPTLRHYFSDREGVAEELLRVLGERARPFIQAVCAPTPSLASAISSYVALSKAGVALGGFARAHMFGLLEGVANDGVGKRYLDTLLEPSLGALESRLLAHLPPETDPLRVRAAALMIFAPMLLAVIHQTLLGGAEAAPMDLDALFEEIGSLAQTAIGASPGERT